jgi:hypothetical protein
MHRSPADRERREALHDITCTPPRRPPEPIPTDARRAHLDTLRLALKAATDLHVSLVGPPACTSLTLHIVNARGGRLSEAVTCDFRDDHWSFVWSWGDVIGPADDVHNAAEAIRHVLTPRM